MKPGATSITGDSHARSSVYFDADRRAWVIQRADAVLAALRAPQLVQSDAQFRPTPHRSDQARRSRRVTEFLSARLQDVRSEMEVITRRVGERLPNRGQCELVSEWIQPWAIDALERVLELRGYQKPLYRFTARHMPGNPRGHLGGRIRMRLATKLFASICPDADDDEAAMRRSVFLGLTQTLPAFLASAWHRLLQNPAEAVRIRSEPESMPLELERLLCRAGHVHTLYRVVTGACSIEGVPFAAGDRVVLQLDSANRDLTDAAQSCPPHAPTHVSFGAGPHACPGAGAVRALAAVATNGMLRRWTVIKLSGPAEWSHGSTMSSPISLPVTVSSMQDVPKL